ncbi:DeoR/GlpR family DNA-binding transcription regulator [Brooklawnia cerclae]|uniref:DeoR family transcriptional regulator of aga operon n=1 Tax=Brooklawnia cerclae TaxID=349934 RepID=A0ABX0SHP1_9ACTN|nr:DeoR/GlpR family DNA-binding transcription regulator [Brooklawnia cerclae]NIH56843.1 DeoR family transcriptional regulator of aga operon [Brooklawnia cerclae]
MSSVHGPSIAQSRRQDRLLRLLDAINQSGYIAVQELADQMQASTATIRRDIAALADQGLAVRTRGGVQSTSQGNSVPLELRAAVHWIEKQAIGEAAAARVPRGPCAVALAGGTTVAAVLTALGSRSDLTIVTNSIAIALRAAEQRHRRVLLAGGIVDAQSLELVGSLTESTLRQLNVRIAFVGCNGIQASAGVTDHDDIAARTSRVLMSRADEVVVVADGSKVGQVALAKSADTAGIDVLITDSRADPTETLRLSHAGVRVIAVDPVHRAIRRSRAGTAG